MSILTALVPALIPAASDGLRAIFNRITGGAGAKPANVAELVQLLNVDIERLKVLAQLDTPGNVSTWVANFRALQRPALASWIMVLYGAALLLKMDQGVIAHLADAANMVVFYLFGDKSYSYIKGSVK